MWATVIFSLGATKPGPPRTCLGTMAKAVAAAPLVNMNLRRESCRFPGETLRLCGFIGIRWSALNVVIPSPRHSKLVLERFFNEAGPRRCVEAIADMRLFLDFAYSFRLQSYEPDIADSKRFAQFGCGQSVVVWKVTFVVQKFLPHKIFSYSAVAISLLATVALPLWVHSDPPRIEYIETYGTNQVRIHYDNPADHSYVLQRIDV